MVKPGNSSVNGSRKRGRPAGQNRTPLSKEERRARNAQYERERRNEFAEALSQLAEAVGCDPHVSQAELLATVVNYIRSSTVEEASNEIGELEESNERLQAQLIKLEQRLFEAELSPSNVAEDASGFNTARTMSYEVYMKMRKKNKAPMENTS